MAKPNLARLEPVPLRTAWASESRDFTPWLASPENLKLLGEAIGLELELEKVEHDVGQYRADIVCRELENNQRVAIENQIEETNHKHLGQILTYAAGVEAGIVVWIAQKFTEPHRAAIDWLNERTNGTAGFFGIEIELYRIGNSPAAPRFNVVSQPNDWTKRQKRSVNEGFTDAEQIRMKYWDSLVAALKAARSGFQCLKASERSSMAIKDPPPGYRAGFEFYPTEGRAAAYFGSRKAEGVTTLRRLLKDHQAAFEKEVGQKIEVSDNAENGPLWIECYTTSEPRNEANWPREHEWLRVTLEKLIAAVTKCLSTTTPLDHSR
jgi:hypothetical protein